MYAKVSKATDYDHLTLPFISPLEFTITCKKEKKKDFLPTCPLQNVIISTITDHKTY